MYPPAQLVQPIPEPEKPQVPDRELVLEDVILWYEDYLSRWREAFGQAEADKAAIREWGIKE